MRKVVIVVVALLGVLLAADRIGVVVAENAAATTIQRADHLKAEPSVDISGFPFLTQLLAQSLDHVIVEAKNVPLGNQQINVNASLVRADMHDVSINMSLRTVTIGHGTATAILRYSDLSTAFDPVHFSYAGDGKVKAGIIVAGQDIGFDVNPQLVGNGLQFGYDNLPLAAKIAAQALGVAIPLDKIPFGLKLQSLSAEPNGIAVHLSGDHVTFKRG